ncbi:MAG: hypothetical protein V3T08_08635 [Gemmatimonadota bacterium]
MISVIEDEPDVIRSILEQLSLSDLPALGSPIGRAPSPNLQQQPERPLTYPPVPDIV